MESLTPYFRSCTSEKRKEIQDDYAIRNERIHAVDPTIYESCSQDNQVVIVDEHIQEE